LFELAFEKIGIEKIWADINLANIAILKVIERLGFKSEGLLRKDRIIGGRRVDVLRIDLLREEFKKQK
jgi:[ribosomal protein S5]-alanine N-acetyltransferase